MVNLKLKVAIVIVSFNGGKEIGECLESIKTLNTKHLILNTIVVDNVSTDGSVQTIKELILIENRKNLGFAGGVNVGIREALKNGADFVFLLNQDAVVTKDSVRKLAAIANSDDKIGIVGSLILNQDKKVWSAGGIIDKKRFTAGHLYEDLHITCHPEFISGSKTMLNQVQHDARWVTCKEVDFVSGCAMLVKKQVFEKIGLFDERFFLYYEDADFCLRAKRAGFKVIFAPQAVVYHHVNKKNTRLKEYYMARNHFLLLEKHASAPVKIREIIRLPKTIFEHLRRGQKHAVIGIKDYFLTKLRTPSRCAAFHLGGVEVVASPPSEVFLDL